MCDHTEVDCFFDPYTDSLHFAYIGGQLVTEMLRDSVIQDFERQYTKVCKEEAYNDKLDSMIANYELKKELA
jgi:tryptophan synthase beta subunit